jgi:hypothetical protein
MAPDFTIREIENLRRELLQNDIDSRHAKEIVSAFLAGQGYGISADSLNEIPELIFYPDCFKAVLEARALCA